MSKRRELTVGRYYFIITLSVVLGIVIGKSCERERLTDVYQKEIKVKEDSLTMVVNKYKSLQKEFRDHMSKCAFISTYSIEKWNGRHILLYSELNTNRKPYKIDNYGNN